jgi:hypothetical protein
MSRAILVPIIAVLCLAIKSIWGVEIDAPTQAEIANVVSSVVLLGATLVGIFKSYKKDKAE